MLLHFLPPPCCVIYADLHIWSRGAVFVPRLLYAYVSQDLRYGGVAFAVFVDVLETLVEVDAHGLLVSQEVYAEQASDTERTPK